ncbi:MAG: DNA repair exonuclease [Gemmatimonadaceae bacterium]|nr:DNA repair exonuclease [Gemmatimonadaceae bacterium]
MRLVHLSDLHLGFRQYQRLTPAGINQREADVATSFRRAIDRVIELAPDVVLIAGDVFHTVRPTNPAILFAFRQFAHLRQQLPDTRVVMIAGNHDTPRSTETGCILRLFTQLGIDVIDDGPQRLSIPELELSILAVPDVPGTRPALRPEPGVRYNVLLLHGEVEGMLPAHAMTVDRAALEISHEELGAERWDYVALGHYHVYREIAPNAYYAGSIDYTSANAWGEVYEQRVAKIPGKGIIERDLATGRHEFHPLPPSRELLDLIPISAAGLNAADVDAAIRDAIETAPGGIDDRIVRLIVRDVPRHLVRELDHKAVREYQRRALHFLLDTRRPDVTRASAISGSPGKRPSLADLVRGTLQGRVIDADVNRETLVSLGLHYLEEAERLASVDAEGAAAVAAGRSPDDA